MTEKKITSNDQTTSSSFFDREHWARKELIKKGGLEVDEKVDEGGKVQKQEQQQGPSWARKAFIVKMKATSTMSAPQRRGSAA